MKNFTINGIVSYPKTRFLGYEKNILANELHSIIQSDLTKLSGFIKAGIFDQTGPTLTLYKDVNFAANRVHMISAIPIMVTKDYTLARETCRREKLVVGYITEQKFVLKATLTSGYDDLAEAWQKAYQFIEENGLATDAYLFPWESYIATPEIKDGKADYSNVITEIYIPLLNNNGKNGPITITG